MILLLKDEYRVKGIAQIIEKRKDHSIVFSMQTAVSEEKTLVASSSEEVEIISEALYQILNTGLFDVQKTEEKTQVRLNTDILTTLFQSALPNKRAGSYDCYEGGCLIF
ncbi:hypothetical protein SporoP37_16700 (plasmid) [Sporosarcina sp. P37]|nr:hypothetical protein SporoP37_16700 [Sporosarcina sp. P37]PID17639.1 hypothetical protein CSV62_12650 [Sporosarcina sp. P35]